MTNGDILYPVLKVSSSLLNQYKPAKLPGHSMHNLRDLSDCHYDPNHHVIIREAATCKVK